MTRFSPISFRGLAACMALHLSLASAQAQIALTEELVDAGFAAAVQVEAAPGDRERLFVLDQNGNIWIVKDDVRQVTPFLDITSLTSRNGERGLLGLAFHPDYQNNGWFFVNYTDLLGDTQVMRYTVSANPDLADAGSATQVLFLDQPYGNHNGGCIRFGPDGYLYIGTGDGGGSGDPWNLAQDPQSMLGKMLRLDVDTLPYTIPPSNPFVGDPNTLDEIWALGLRNPWRFNFDAETGDMYIADVGQEEWEYVHFEPAGDPGGRNYGWRILEGSHCYNPSNCSTTGLELPIFEYGHSFFPNRRCCIIGSETYRGRSMASMRGRYFFSDACSLDLLSFRYDPVHGVTDPMDHTSESGIEGSGSSLGTDHDGELYVCDGTRVYRVVPAGMYLKVPHLEVGVADSIQVVRCTPSSPVYLAYSMSGLGSFAVPSLGVTVMLDNPALAATTTADANGEASFAVVPPGALFDRTVWLGAVQDGQVSNVTIETIE